MGTCQTKYDGADQETSFPNRLCGADHYGAQHPMAADGRLCGADHDGPHQMMVAHVDILKSGRIDEWSTLDPPPVCCAYNHPSAASRGLQSKGRFLADVPDGEMYMVMEDGDPVWVREVRDDDSHPDVTHFDAMQPIGGLSAMKEVRRRHDREGIAPQEETPREEEGFDSVSNDCRRAGASGP